MMELLSAYQATSLTRSDQISACRFPAARNGLTHGRNAKPRTTLGPRGKLLLVLDRILCTETKRPTMCIGRSCAGENSDDTVSLLRMILKLDTNYHERLTDCSPVA